MGQVAQDTIEEAMKEIGQRGQGHLGRFVDGFSEDQKQEWLGDIQSLDFDMLDDLIERYVRCDPEFKLPEEILAPEVYPASASDDQKEKYQKALNYGRQMISQNKVAAFTVAGGMGTRLNFDGPKGDVAATPVRNKSLFRVFAEGVMATQRRYNCIVPWYIMTSEANHQATVESFGDNDYFGLDKANVIMFRQGMMPCFNPEGKILMSSEHRLSMSPDGHGGSLRALYKSGALADMAERGVEYISYFQVDNPLLYVVDPLFIGLHALDEAEMSSKAVIKAEALEKVGNFTLADGKVQVIEYSDLPDELAQQKREDGGLTFEYGSIAIHIINRSFVERINGRGFSLPWHRAVKRVPFIDGDGKKVEPGEPNAIKLETFVFDALPLAGKSIILEVDRAERFAPTKNEFGVDSLATARQLQIERAGRWMEHAGVKVPRKPDGSVDATIEISALFALDPDELADKKDQLPAIQAGDNVYLE